MAQETTRWPAAQPFEETLPTLLGVAEGVKEAPRSQLGNSIWADLRRFEASPTGFDLLVVMAACMRHVHSLDIHIRMRGQLEVLSIYPQAQSFRCALDLCGLPPGEMRELGLLHVEPAATLLGPEHSLQPSPSLRTGQLRLLLWLMALHGPRAELLPEIDEPARFRLAPGLDLLSLPLDLTLTQVLDKMHDRPLSVDELASGSELGRPGVVRLLNALYLQSGLIVTRHGVTPWSMQRAVDVVRRTIPSGFGKRS
jgi:hypothetical protein